MATPACSHKGCARQARFRPVWLLAFQETSNRRWIPLGIRVCEEHRREIRRLFSSRRGQQSMAHVLTRRLRATPDWTRSRICFERLH
jgi:hypothetical protein